MGAGRFGDIVHRAAVCGKGIQVAAGDDQHALAVGREAEGEHLSADVLVFGTAVDVVILQIDGHFLAFAGLDIIFVDVAAVLEDDILLRIRGEFAVVLGEVGDFARLAREGVVAEEVHRPVTVGEVVDLVADPHREDVLRVVVGDLLQFGRTHAVDPDVVGLAAAIVFPGAEFAEHPVHGQVLPVGRIAAEAAFGGRNLLGRAAGCVHLAELAAQATESMRLAAIDDLFAVGCPAHDDVVGTHAFADQVTAHEGGIGHAPGFAARDGNRVHFGIAVVLAGESHGLAVGRDAREHFIAHVRGKLDGRTAVEPDAVKVAGVAEDDVVTANGGEPEQPGLLALCCKGQQRKQGCQHREDSLHTIRY